MEEVRQQHEEDLKKDGGYVKLPSALDGKYPGAAREWGWQWVFPSHRPHKDLATGHIYRHHLFETVLQKAIRDAAIHSRIPKLISCHTLRHSFATHLFEDGYDIRTSTRRMPIRKSPALRIIHSQKKYPVQLPYQISLMESNTR